MPRLTIALASLIICAGSTFAADAPISLFDGKSLSGFSFFLADPKVKMEDVWSVRDGLLVCKGEPIGYLKTKASYTSFRLVVEWRWAPGTLVDPKRPPNSGVLMRISGEDKAVPRAYEAQLKSGDAGDLYGFWGLVLEGEPARSRSAKGHAVLGDLSGVARIEGAENPVGEWNRCEITLDGTRLVVSVNGRKVNEAVARDVIAGPIGLQSEGGEIHFRKVQIEPLP